MRWGLGCLGVLLIWLSCQLEAAWADPFLLPSTYAVKIQPDLSYKPLMWGGLLRPSCCLALTNTPV